MKKLDKFKTCEKMSLSDMHQINGGKATITKGGTIILGSGATQDYTSDKMDRTFLWWDLKDVYYF